MMSNPYSRPSSSRAVDSVHPRTLRPLGEPPAAFLLYPPVLPLHAAARTKELSTIFDEFDFSTHVVPAAYPRMTPFVPPSALAPSGARAPDDKDERKAWSQRAVNVFMDTAERQARRELSGERDMVLWNCVNRYVRRAAEQKGKKSITLLLAHANGFPKEIWEPFLRCLLSCHSSVNIDEIWSFEAVNHGDAAMLNEEKLGVCFDWSDNARDTLNFLTRYLPSGNPQNLPVHLPRVPHEETDSRIFSGFSDRTLIAVGHSFGGCTSTLAALTMPRLFTGLILVDPVISPIYARSDDRIRAMASSAVQRRSEWPSLTEARRLLSANPFFSVWDPTVLDIYLSCGLAQDLLSDTVRLKTTPIQEAALFANQQTSYEVFERLRDLDPRIPLRFVMAGKGRSIAGSEEANTELVWRRPENASNVRIASASHLIPQEAPRELALEVCATLEAMASTPSPDQYFTKSKL